MLFLQLDCAMCFDFSCENDHAVKLKPQAMSGPVLSLFSEGTTRGTFIGKHT